MRKAVPAIFFCLIIQVAALYPEKLETINKQIRETEEKLLKLKKEKKSTLNDIYAVELRLEKAVSEKQGIDVKLQWTEAEIKEKQARKQDLEIKIQGSRENIAKALRVLYKLGRIAYLKFFLRVETFDDLFRNYRLFTALIDYKADEIKGLQTNIRALEKLDNELKEQHRGLLVLKGQEEEKIKSIGRIKQEKEDLLASINSDRNAYVKLLAELKEEAASLDDMIKTRETVVAPGTVNLGTLKGRLRWPLDGKVISTFGRKKSTQFDTYIIHNGIEIKPQVSDRVEAIYEGEVVFADYFKGYGNLVIVQHAKNFHSLYGHCDKILKNKGDKVDEGEVVALAGQTGSTSGKSLYLEIRKDLKPENPLQWLSKK